MYMKFMNNKKKKDQNASVIILTKQHCICISRFNIVIHNLKNYEIKFKKY